MRTCGRATRVRRVSDPFPPVVALTGMYPRRCNVAASFLTNETSSAIPRHVGVSGPLVYTCSYGHIEYFPLIMLSSVDATPSELPAP
jgi:hypothetical protein